MTQAQRQRGWDDIDTQKSIDGIRRQIRSLGTHAGDEDAWLLGEVAKLQDEMMTLQFTVMRSLRDRGYEWAEIGRALGTSAGAARVRFARCETPAWPGA